VNNFVEQFAVIFITALISFIFGILSYGNKRNKELLLEKLNNFYAPVARILSVGDIEYENLDSMINAIYQIALNNYKYVPQHLFDIIADLKRKGIDLKNIDTDLKSFKKLIRIVDLNYISLQEKLGLDSEIYFSNKKLKIYYILKTVSSYIPYIVYLLSFATFLNVFIKVFPIYLFNVISAFMLVLYLMLTSLTNHIYQQNNTISNSYKRHKT